MERFYEEIDIDECRQDVTHRFKAAVNIAEDAPVYERMLRESKEAHDKAEDRIRLRAAYTWLSKEEISLQDEWLKGFTTGEGYRRNENAPVSDSAFDNDAVFSIRCPAFSQIEEGSVEGAWFYAINAGLFDLEDEALMLQLYADMWGTAYAEAAMECLKSRFEDSPLMEGKLLSDNFGPGYYGMDVSEIMSFPRVVDYEQAGIKISDSGIMEPAKTLTGLFLAVDASSGYHHIPANCRDCSGRMAKAGCRFCVLKPG